ncbi:MAG: ABC transporter ATP-binding protein [Dehalococcoidia bacterium]
MSATDHAHPGEDWLLYGRDLSRSFGAVRVLDRVTVGLASGTIVGLVGPNGAGKTTLLSVLAGILPPDSGAIWLGGEWVDFDANPERRRALGLMLNGRLLIDELRPLEYFEFVSAMYGVGPAGAEELSAMVERLRLEPHFKTAIKNLSAGTKKKVEFVAALLHRPKVLLFDEPFEAIDPPSVHELTEFTRDYVRETGAAAIISSHILPYVRPLATEVRLLWRGRLYEHAGLEQLLAEVGDDRELETWRTVLDADG